MDQIRKKQIAEVSGENKIIGNMMFALEKRWFETETDNVLPYPQLDAEVLDVTTSTANTLLVLLDKKRVETHNSRTISHSNTRGSNHLMKFVASRRSSDFTIL